MLNSNRPIVVTIERDSNCPCGRPVATNMRPMTLFEYFWYRLKRSFKKTIPITHAQSINPAGLSIGVQISMEQYNKLLGKDPDAKQSIEYLGGWIAMSFIPPPAAYTDELEVGYSV